MEDNCWKLQGECCFEPPSGYYGFIYKITNLENNWIYIGRKAFEHTKKVKLSKKVIKESGTRKRVGKITKDSGWLDYFGSSLYLTSDLEKNGYNCKREIIKLCKDKISLNYWEVAFMIKEEVLFRGDCYNGAISGKWFKNKVHI